MRTAAVLPSRERMLEATIHLLRSAGLSGAGINDIVRESAAPKGSVYHFFPGGKLQIVGEALAIHAGRVEAFMDAALAAGRSHPERVRHLFDAYARRIEEAGFALSCPIGTVTLDLCEEAEPLRPMLAEALAAYGRVIAHHVDLGDARRTRSFAGLVLTAIEGAYIRARAERSGAPFREAGSWLARLVE
jgi:TetR/AcrR family transcriptional repressor of lmrAB and yxaGH operons